MFLVPSFALLDIHTGGLSPSHLIGSIVLFSSDMHSISSLPIPAPVGDPTTFTTPADCPRSTHV